MRNRKQRGKDNTMKKKKIVKRKKDGIVTCPKCEKSFRLFYRVPDDIPEMAKIAGVSTEIIWAGILSGQLPLVKVDPDYCEETVFGSDLTRSLRDH